MFSGSRPTLATSLTVVSAVGWTTTAVIRILVFIDDAEGRAQPVLTIVLAALSVAVAVSAAALIVQNYARRILATLARSESDRDLILAGVHDRIDGAEAKSRADLDSSMNWMIRWITHE